MLEEAERSLHDALCVIRCLVKKRALLPGKLFPLEMFNYVRIFSLLIEFQKFLVIFNPDLRKNLFTEGMVFVKWKSFVIILFKPLIAPYFFLFLKV